MNVLLISQCRKNALTETRRILDQFAERRGDRTWQTAITQQGLDTLHRLLRQTARRNTAVACHWIRGKDHSELIWIVGDARQFNERGATPTNLTARDVLRAGDENDWHTAEDIRLLARLAALFHDFGKASEAFQKKLKSKQPIADAYRHEWVSLRLFESLVRDSGPSDRDWLSRLSDPGAAIGAACLARLTRDGATKGTAAMPPFRELPPLARIVGWLIVSHHRLPTPLQKTAARRDSLEQLPQAITHDWCGSRPDNDNARDCWNFQRGLPLDSRHWRGHAAKLAQAILQRPVLAGEGAAELLLDSPYMLHLSRLALMLADHYYSAQPSHGRYGDKPGKPSATLYANTDKTGALKQRLDEHLIGVEVNASRIVRSLPRLAEALPRIARHKTFRERSQGRFRWQNQAYDCAAALQTKAATQGFFGINMASTGCGKTLANGRILYALADPRLGARFTVALGLRTLTLQTGEAYRERLRLGEADLAVLVGSAATRALHECRRSLAEDERAQRGCESSESLLPEFNHVHYEGSLEDGPLKEWLADSKALRLLDAPVLACTIDHLMPATEGTRGGHQIAPMLRLMTSDLILDEPDDFSVEDLSALARLVHWSGMLGSRVLLSSATLPPALVQGLFRAYLAGRAEFQRNRGMPGLPVNVCCAWFDEFGAEAKDHADKQSYLDTHRRFVDRRLDKLADAARKQVRRRAAIQPLPISPKQPRTDMCRELAGQLRAHMHTLHSHHHSIDPKTGKRVSFGLIRMANIDPLFDVALSLFELGAEASYRIHLCAYHSRHPLLVRASIERELDAALERTEPDAVFGLGSIRERLDSGPEADHIFVVLATAVAEVGRDHDYDWAIVEPSSMRSIIQLAGRVRRHREGNCPEEWPNVYLLDTNVRHLENGGTGPAYTRPGFENASFPLQSHHLSELLTPEQWRILDASPRIRPREPLLPRHNLADLEHARLADLLLGTEESGSQKALPAPHWWETRATLSGELQRVTPFRFDPVEHFPYALLPDDDGKLDLYRVGEGGLATPVGLSPSGQAREIDDPAYGPRIVPWAVPKYLDGLETLAEALNLDLRDCARRYGVIELPEPEGGQRWRYHWALGFSRYHD
ncbi:type I-F CRISPR-associated helicase Cas3f [Methylococcus geothermalis]|uniref:Type I-F CRISPR-associated helicase Cas3 n=1 Tax=Methylococcus geothermalis TaxID=2681310 RepID=A0A858Q696_9GAMM|nr:type I-F CRISPR-associated helicase Cas3f [Methylococcus geothermalis]QJD29392.1 type I-F CRISPR-associated helicase Cas3 [Methylococcus geothermalis]